MCLEVTTSNRVSLQLVEDLSLIEWPQKEGKNAKLGHKKIMKVWADR